jgi:hypothetical protein
LSAIVVTNLKMRVDGGQEARESGEERGDPQISSPNSFTVAVAAWCGRLGSLDATGGPRGGEGGDRQVVGTSGEPVESTLDALMAVVLMAVVSQALP